eukprot:evm.model.NODE_1535_length_5495_cov_18.371429.2
MYLISRISLQLPLGPNDGRAGDDDARRPAMVPYGEMEPVGLKCVLLPTKHDPHISGMLPRGVEIRVISNLGRQVHQHSVHRQKGAGTEGRIFLEQGLCLGEQALNRGACGCPNGARLGHEGIKCRLVEAAGIETGGGGAKEWEGKGVGG